MAETGKQSPLGMNVFGQFLSNIGLNVNPVAASYMGTSKTNASYTPGSLINHTVLRCLTYAINDAYLRGEPGNPIKTATLANCIISGAGSPSGDILQVGSVTSGKEGKIELGMTLSGTGVTPGTTIIGNLSNSDGTTSGSRWLLSTSSTVSTPTPMVATFTPGNTTITNDTYDQLISIGSGTLPVLGNAKPPTYVAEDPAGIWTTAAVNYGIQNGYPSALPGPATSGYGIEGITLQGQSATWLPYNTTNPNISVTQWGYLRLHALQAWNEFNWNSDEPTAANPNYSEFTNSFSQISGWITQENQTISIASNSAQFLDGVYSNMNDLMTGDIAGVNLSSFEFGTDLINLGKVIDLQDIESFGLPSNLLKAITTAGALTKDLSLALLAAGLDINEIQDISDGTIITPTKLQEQKIYGAYLIITGQNLIDVLAPLQCKTLGLTALSDLLDVKMMFPISYAAMTVPIYNADVVPTNSKTYYLLYVDGAINMALDTPTMRTYVGIQIPTSVPSTYERALNSTNYNDVPIGFGAYLRDIIPLDQAIAAGAWSFAMRQVRNIKFTDINRLGKAIQGLENNANLPLTAGTSKPTAQISTDAANSITALGSGPNGTYTMSDAFGCLTGLPYPWELLQNRIQNVSTTKLHNIYRENYLATTWSEAQVTIDCATRTVGPTTYYSIIGITVTDPGGGYGRGNAPVPSITISGGSGATAIVSIGTDDMDMTTFGKVTTVRISSSGIETTSLPTATIEAPPIGALPVTVTGEIATGGTNTISGTVAWPDPMNSVVQGYVSQANAEITSIYQNNIEQSVYLNAYWDICGAQLKREQRTRYKALTPVSIPKNYFSTSYPNQLSNFVDTLPAAAQDTRPHMTVQTLEALADLNTVGGQSLVAMMRESRNQTRLALAGLELDNSIPDTPTSDSQKAVTTNGTIGGAVDGITNLTTGTDYTIPSWPGNIDDGGNVLTPSPIGTYNPDLPKYQPTAGTAPGDITGPLLGADPNPSSGPRVPIGPTTEILSPITLVPFIKPAPEYDPVNLPPNLDPRFITSTILPATLSIPEAIDHVINCNCDCWIN